MAGCERVAVVVVAEHGVPWHLQDRGREDNDARVLPLMVCDVPYWSMDVLRSTALYAAGRWTRPGCPLYTGRPRYTDTRLEGVVRVDIRERLREERVVRRPEPLCAWSGRQEERRMMGAHAT